MVSEGVIQEFIADVNFAVLDYRICYVFTKQEEKNSTSTKNNNSSNRRRKIVIDQLSQIGDILAEIEILGETSIFRLAIREPLAYNENTPINDNISSLIDMGVIAKVIPVSSSRVRSSVYKQKQPYLTPTELKILRCLVLNPQIGIADIANVVAISARTANRIPNRLKDDTVVRFSVICNPSAMKGLVVFGLLIYVNKQGGEAAEEQKKSKKKPNSHKILVLSFQEVRKAELYVFTRIKYHKEWILREIDNRLESKFQSTISNSNKKS